MARRPPTTEQRLAVQQIDDAGQFLINVAIHTARKNPVKMGLWGFGLLLCLFFNGLSVTPEQLSKYDGAVRKAGKLEKDIDSAWQIMSQADAIYRRSQGFFWSCNADCQSKKQTFVQAKGVFDALKSQERAALSEAKSSVGIFSEFGVSDVRYLFTDQFGKGQRFAKRQSQWDALFMGIQSMGRDESLMSYLLRLLLNVLFNFTIGVCGALIGFTWSLWSVLVEYKASIASGLIFFLLAVLAASSYAAIWLAGIYAAAAGTVYVGSRAMIANMRIADGHNQGRVRYDE